MCRLEPCTWQSFGTRAGSSTPHAFEARKLLLKLSTDPAVVAIRKNPNPNPNLNPNPSPNPSPNPNPNPNPNPKVFALREAIRKEQLAQFTSEVTLTLTLILTLTLGGNPNPDPNSDPNPRR